MSEGNFLRDEKQLSSLVVIAVDRLRRDTRSALPKFDTIVRPKQLDADALASATVQVQGYFLINIFSLHTLISPYSNCTQSHRLYNLSTRQRHRALWSRLSSSTLHIVRLVGNRQRRHHTRRRQ